MDQLKIGLLPLYIKLYDDNWPELRKRTDPFLETISSELSKKGTEVISAKVCRIQQEFEDAVQLFESEDVDAIVTLHLAYSPSLESVNALSSTNLPIVVLDTTPAYEFSPSQESEEILYNHGIHGVQDMCNLLIRNEKEFLIEAGHWKSSDVLDRVVAGVKAAKITKKMKTAKVGRIGDAFHGMGDFSVADDLLHSTIGIETISIDLHPDHLSSASVSDEEIDKEMGMDQLSFQFSSLENDVYRQATHDCLTIRNVIEDRQMYAFTINFLDVTKNSGISSMPFLEASKAMARGIGYAGEGDVLTAALVGALLSVYPDASFTEMFCPDWKNGRIFLSHMGEMNLRSAAETPVLKELDFPFTDANNTIVAYGRFRGGNAVYVCLAPGKNQTYTLILSPGEMLDVKSEDKMRETIRGWFTPSMPISEFLSSFSKNGGIHHGAIVYGEALPVLKRFGEYMGWKVVVLESEA
ncbi:hypothetical protein EVU96_08265 [Bacillus infantis]|uniref:L-arabinose isomerase family protein n=1 Tax=Bacillus infantis TaxID=324767 RepID=UPI00101C5840|nr:hypothetical protein [Bacillus infantis]RYI30398.1 hypothetical protein EVU96_08265 [Bacillus infantis]